MTGKSFTRRGFMARGVALVLLGRVRAGLRGTLRRVTVDDVAAAG